MLPTLKPGHIVLAVGVFKAVSEGDVVIVCHGGLEKIKRVSQYKNGRIYIVGDNQLRSTDSRTFGWIDVQEVAGRVIWPRTRIK